MRCATSLKFQPPGEGLDILLSGMLCIGKQVISPFSATLTAKVSRHKLLQRMRDADGFSKRVPRRWQAMSLKARCISSRLMQVPFAGTHGEKKIGIAQTVDSIYEQSMLPAPKRMTKRLLR